MQHVYIYMWVVFVDLFVAYDW